MLIVANWKAYVDSVDKAKKLVTSAKRLRANYKHDIVIAPSSPYLGLFVGGKKSKLIFGAQDVSSVISGARTGEVTASALSSAGVKYAIIGHSERRAQGETNEMILEKCRRALAVGITPILCVGELSRDEEGFYLQQIRDQITSVFQALSIKERLQMVVAYEPVWAIGKSAFEAIHPSDLAEMVMYIRKVIGEFVFGKALNSIRVIYGGSAEPTNARDLAAAGGIDGFLVGHASADVSMFAALIKAVS